MSGGTKGLINVAGDETSRREDEVLQRGVWRGVPGGSGSKYHPGKHKPGSGCSRTFLRLYRSKHSNQTDLYIYWQ